MWAWRYQVVCLLAQLGASGASCTRTGVALELEGERPGGWVRYHEAFDE